MTRYGRKGRLLTAAGMALLIAACEENKRPIDAPPPAPLAEFDSGGALAELPYAEPARVQYYQPEQAYPYAERAYGLQRAFYDAPPDYGFYYDDVSPYVWETSDDWTLYAEPWEGDYRYYYYEPGAAYPYFIRDDDYGYAFSPAGLLIAMFYPDGRYAPAEVVYSYAPLAGRYYARGRDLRRVERRAEHFRVSDDVWMTEAPRVSRSANPWLRAARDDRRWREWRERNDDRELRRFQAETRRREEAAGAWRERAARQQLATIERRDERLEAEGLSARRGARDDRRERRDAIQEARARAEGDRRQAIVEQRQAQQGAQAERRRAQTGRQAERRRDAQEQARRAELKRRAEAQSLREQQTRVEAQRQRAQQQAEVRRAQQVELRRPEVEQRQQFEAERRQAEAQQRRQAQAEREQAAAQQRQQAQAERQARREQQARAPSAAERGKPAAANEDEKRGRERENRRD